MALSLGKLTALRRVKSLSIISPSSSSRSLALICLSSVAVSAIRSPLIFLTPGKEMSSVVPVAMAMLPEKVEQEAMALASPAFWMVVVAETLQAAYAPLAAARAGRAIFIMEGILCSASGVLTGILRLLVPVSVVRVLRASCRAWKDAGARGRINK